MIKMKNTLMRIFIKIPCHIKIISDNRKLYTQLINCFNNINNLYSNINISQPYTTNQYDSSLSNIKYKIPNRYRIKRTHYLINRFKIMNLRWQHDKNFNLQSFKRGTKQAMSVITKSLHENKKTYYYIDWPANEVIEQKVREWNDSVRSNIALEPSQIYTIILNVEGIKFSDAMLYRIDTLGIGYKPHVNYNYLVEIFLKARFERIYRKSVKPEWYITDFDITRMIFHDIP